MDTITITFCDRAENHVGMQQLGEIANSGFTLQDLKKCRKWFKNKGITADIYDLGWQLQDLNLNPDKNAYILIVRNGINAVIGENSHNLHDQLINLDWDTKAFMYGRVVNKKARYNLCFTDNTQEPNYQNGKGRVVSFSQIPLLQSFREKIPQFIGSQYNNLVAEGNYYYDSSKCGIGYHGDSERRLVIGVRLGNTMPLSYQWYLNNEKVGEKMIFKIKNGDIYIMSDKAVGYDWKRKTILTLRHAAGSSKYIYN